MVTLKSAAQIEEMKIAGQFVASCHKRVAEMIRPGITTQEINDEVERLIAKAGGRAPTLGYNGYPYATCTSVNDVIAHGFPNNNPLRQGDIVTVDIVAELNGWVGDSAWSYAVGSVSEEAEKLMRVTKECMYIGIERATIGSRIGDVVHAIQQHAEQNGFGVVRELLAHGVGREMHEEPNFPHVGSPGKGFRLKEGMVLTIEPMLNEGTYRMTIDDDGWTARTADGKLSAQYEHTIAITKAGPVILTAQE